MSLVLEFIADVTITWCCLSSDKIYDFNLTISSPNRATPLNSSQKFVKKRNVERESETTSRLNRLSKNNNYLNW